MGLEVSHAMKIVSVKSVKLTGVLHQEEVRIDAMDYGEDEWFVGTLGSDKHRLDEWLAKFEEKYVELTIKVIHPEDDSNLIEGAKEAE